MSNPTTKRSLPDLPHPEFLRKQAKTRLSELRMSTPSAKLAHVQLVMAREYGFASWAALLAEVARRQESPRGQWRRIRRNPLALPHGMNASADCDVEAHFLHAGVAAQIGFFLAALIGVALVAVLAGGYPAVAEQLAQLAHR